MIIRMPSSTPRLDPFPNVHTIILSGASLASSPYLIPLFTLTNDAFSYSHSESVAGKEYLPKSMGRYRQPTDIFDELGPEGFCMLAFEDAESTEIIGTISARPFNAQRVEKGEKNHARFLFKRAPSTHATTLRNGRDATEKAGKVQEVEQALLDPDIENWELLASVVTFRVKGMGLASKLMEMCIDELRRMSLIKYRDRGGQGEVKMGLYLSTMKELNEEYYLKRGWVTTAENKIEKGVMGSRDGFSVAEMVRITR